LGFLKLSDINCLRKRRQSDRFKCKRSTNLGSRGNLLSQLIVRMINELLLTAEQGKVSVCLTDAINAIHKQ